MSLVRWIQGGVTASSLRGLVVARGLSEDPRVGVFQGTTELAKPSVTRVPGPGAVRDGLDRRGVRVYLVTTAGLSAGTTHRVVVAGGSQPVAATVTTLPTTLPPEGLSVGVATCYYDGYKRDGALRDSLLTPQRDHLVPNFHIWAGDNLYLDVPGDSVKDLPFEHTLDRYLRYFLDSGYAQTRAVAPTFSTYDDHEYWNNYPCSTLWLSRSWDRAYENYQKACIECMDLFQGSLNPPNAAGTRGYFSFAIEPLNFFFLDIRTYRTRQDRSRLVAEGAQQALSDWIDGLSGPGVLVLGQPLWSATGDKLRDFNLPAFERDYAAIWKHLRRAPYDMLVISGDVHHSRVLRIGFQGAPNRTVFEFVTSPACHIPNLLGSVGVGNSQARGSLDEVPSSVEHAGQQLSARAFFGTDSPHCWGLLRFTRVGYDQVRVGASLIEHYPQNRFAPAQPIKTLPRAARQYSECHEPSLCVLRQR
ncbi:MAG: alkaline phosphatase D family protein [Polyangiales bacterium]